MHDFVKVSSLASKQAGVVSRPQLFGLDVSHNSIQFALKSGVLVRHRFRGVYRLASTTVTRNTHLWAALLFAGESAVLSHVTAGWLWKLEGLGKKPPDLIDVSVPEARQLAMKKSLCAWRVRRLDLATDYGIVAGFPCTSLARTLIDLAAVLSPAALEHAFDSAVRRSEDNRTALFDALKRLGTRGRRGIASLVEIASRDELGATHSWLENETRQLLRREGLPTPLPQYEIDDERGNFICRPDFAWPEVRLALFCDSWKHHGPRDAFEHDRTQRNQLELIDWHPIAVTHRRLIADEAGFVAELRRFLGRRL